MKIKNLIVALGVVPALMLGGAGQSSSDILPSAEPLVEETTSSWSSARQMSSSGLSTPANGWSFDHYVIGARYGRSFGYDQSTRFVLRVNNVQGGTADDGRTYIYFNNTHDPLRISYPGGNAYADSFRWEMWQLSGNGNQPRACADGIGLDDSMIDSGLSMNLAASGDSLRRVNYHDHTLEMDSRAFNGSRYLCFITYRTSDNADSNLEIATSLTADASRSQNARSNTRITQAINEHRLR